MSTEYMPPVPYYETDRKPKKSNNNVVKNEQPKDSASKRHEFADPVPYFEDRRSERRTVRNKADMKWPDRLSERVALVDVAEALVERAKAL